jgi:DNA-binding MarR family transcriptional regulator
MTTSPAAAAETLREVTRLYARAQRVVADCCSTTNTQCHILGELGRAGPMTPAELGTRLQLEKSWVSRALETMVQRELIAKDDNPSDARSWIVSLTPLGKRRYRELNATLDGHAAKLLASLDQKERQDVQRALVLLLNLLREDPSANCCLPSAQLKKELTCR